jgi:hypothetical protein
MEDSLNAKSHGPGGRLLGGIGRLGALQVVGSQRPVLAPHSYGRLQRSPSAGRSRRPTSARSRSPISPHSCELGVTPYQRAVIQMGEDVAREQVALGGMRITGQDERLDAEIGVALQLGKHLVGIADDRRAGA